MNNYFGKYRGKVENNVDPMFEGRIQISCASVLGDGKMSWATPCVPFAGNGVGLFVLPPNGTNIWVEFEGGNTDFPIWSGCFWGTGEVPAQPATEQVIVFKATGVTLTISQIQQGITLDVSPPLVPIPLKITLDANGIEFTNTPSKITIAPAGVKINDGALEVI